MPDVVLATILSSLFSILAGIIAAFVSSTFYAQRTKTDLQKEYDTKFNDRKWEAYTHFAQIVSDILLAVKQGKSDELEKFVAQLYEFTRQLWIVGSKDVVEAFIEWRRYGQSEDRDSKEYLIQLGNIIIAMRKDLGYSTDNIKSAEILATIIDDFLKLK